MENLIKYLHEKSSENTKNGEPLKVASWDKRHGVLISNSIAGHIASALQVAENLMGNPPLIRAAMSCLEHSDLYAYHWAGIYRTGWLYAFDQEPVYRHLEKEWWRSDLNDIQIELGCFGETLMQGMDSKLLLLKRNGLQWEWVYREEYRNSQ